MNETRPVHHQMPYVAAAAAAFAFIFFLSSVAWGEEPARSFPIKTVSPNQLTLPLVVVPPGQKKGVCVNLRLDWSRTYAVGDDPLSFQFNKPGDEVLAQNLRAQLWISALATAIAWQEPWLSARWGLGEAPVVEGPAAGAALSVGMIAAAAKLGYPPDTIIIGSLNPDGTIGSVSDILARVDAAAAGGFKRVVIPAQQRIEMSDAGNFVNVETRAKSLGLECVLVDDLTEAVEKVLKTTMPRAPILSAPPRIEGPLLNFLDSGCQKELSRLQSGSASWPRTPFELKRLKPQQQALWEQIIRDYDPALDAYRSGQLYVAWLKFNELNAKIAAVKEWENAPKKFDYKGYDDRATALRQKISSLVLKPAFDKNDLQSAMILAEQADWLYTISARIKGAQTLAQQAFGSRTSANQQQINQAQMLLVNAVASAQYQLEDMDFYARLYGTLSGRSLPAVSNRPSIWLPQLASAHLAQAELLSVGLRQNSNLLRESLLYDLRLAAQAEVLREAKAIEEKRLQEKAKQALQNQPRSTTIKIGFVPGQVYSPPKLPVQPGPVSKMSDTVRCLIGVNDYCEVAVLEQKYLRLKGSFESPAQTWRIRDRGALQSLLQSAEVSARRGIASAQKAGIETSVLSLIYENAGNLRASDDDSLRLEALRQYWRCALLGTFCWQLGSPPDLERARRASPPPPVTILPPALPEIIKPSASPERDLGHHEGPPIEAVAVTPLELEEDMKRP